MNAHIWELDGCVNENGRRMKGSMNDLWLKILNCVWNGLSEATWFTETKQFTLDYVCMDGRAGGKLWVLVYLIEEKCYKVTMHK